MKVIVARRAERDQMEIGAWIARDKRRAADRIPDRPLTATRGLSRNPHRHPSIGLRGLRERPVGGCLIVYRIDDTINVVRIPHAGRDWPSMLGET